MLTDLLNNKISPLCMLIFRTITSIEKTWHGLKETERERERERERESVCVCAFAFSFLPADG